MRLKYTILGICMVQASLIVITRGQGGCPEPQEPVHGFSYRRGQDESTVNFGCHTGYQLSGNSEAFCICNRYGCSWSSQPPICEEVGSGRSRDCPQPQVPVNGYIVESNGGQQARAFVIYGCDEGYIIRGGDTSTCSCLGAQCQWTTIPSCQQNGGRTQPGSSCTEPLNIVDGYIIARAGGLQAGDTVTYQCYQGFTLQGQATSRCDCGGTSCAWTPRPTCRRELQGGSSSNPNQGSSSVPNQGGSDLEEDCPRTTEDSCTCDNPGTPANGCSRIQRVDGFCDKIKYSCRRGYKLVGSRTYQCPGFGFRFPKCEVDGCAVPGALSNGQFSPMKGSYEEGDSIRFTCNRGYTTLGPKTKRCGENGWSPLDRTYCGPVPCGPAPLSAHLMRVDRGRSSFGAVARFQCREGYRLSDGSAEATRTCQADRSWSGSIPTCERVSCGYPGSPVNGRVLDHSWREQTYDYGSMLQFTCNRGYRLVGTSRISCLASGLWSSDLPECQAVICPMEYLRERLIVAESQLPIEGEGYRVDATLDFSCEQGYRLQGASSVVCQQSGRWTYRFPKCEIVSCGTAAAPTNGRMEGRSFTYGSMVIFSCNNGYNLRGSSHLQCQANGRWNGTLPACLENGCGALPRPANGRVQLLGEGPGSTSVFSCNNNYELIGESVSTCMRDGWDNPPPICREIRCPIPNRLLNGEIEGENFSIGGEIKFSCDDHYTLVGSGTSVCTSAGTWSHAYPLCQVQECRHLANPTNGVTIAPSLELDSVATFMCFRGYTLSGSSSARCLPDKTWSVDNTTCKACPVGTYKDSTSDTGCTPCPEGSSTATVASTSRYQCICQGDRTGSPGGPCMDSQCDRPLAPENGSIKDCDDEQNGRCYVECDPGYVVRGSRVRTCLNSEWLPKDMDPTCHVCPRDTYSTGGSRTSCQLCPARSHTNGSVGAKSIESCECSPGYRRDTPDGPCLDINECEESNGGCSGRGAQCHNNRGSFSCSCTVPGSALDSTGKNCILVHTCGDLTQEPKNGYMNCISNEEYNSNTCHVVCNKGHFFVSGNDYVTCGENTDWTYSHQSRNRSAELPACMEEFYIDTMFNLSTAIEVPASCGSYIDNLEADYNINEVLHEKGDCSDYRCSTRPEEIFQRCLNTDAGGSQLQLNFSVYLENPEDDRIADDCERQCQGLRLRSMLVATGRIWTTAKKVFLGDLGEVKTVSGESLTLNVAQLTASRPDIRCHEPGRVFTKRRTCVPCSEGYYLASRTDSKCSPCPEGEYQDETGQTSCKPCPDGLTTLAPGTPSSVMCITQQRVDTIVAGLQVGDTVILDN